MQDSYERLDEMELARRFPQFKVIGKMIGYYEPGGGFIRPEACIEAQLDLAKQAGAERELGTIVKQLHLELAGVRVETDRGDFHAKRVVLAAGAWLPKLAGRLVQQLESEPASTVLFQGDGT
jgi:sarcosine oxidase